MNAQQSKMIEQLYLEMHDLLMAYARSSLEGENLAEEAVQETFRIACVKPECLCESPNPKGWLINALKYTIQNMKRTRENANRLLIAYMASQGSGMAVSQDGIRLEILYEDVAELEEFQLLKELAVEGKSHLEMARERGISLNACKKRVQRAKEMLKKKIKKDVTL